MFEIRKFQFRSLRKLIYFTLILFMTFFSYDGWQYALAEWHVSAGSAFKQGWQGFLLTSLLVFICTLFLLVIFNSVNIINVFELLLMSPVGVFIILGYIFEAIKIPILVNVLLIWSAFILICYAIHWSIIAFDHRKEIKEVLAQIHSCFLKRKSKT